MKQHESDKPYMPTQDPYFLEAERVQTPTFLNGSERNLPTSIFGGERVVTFIILALILILFRMYSWIGLAAGAGIGIVLLVSMSLLKRAAAANSMKPGYVNKHRQMTMECLSPKEKKLNNKYFKLKCTDCGRIHHAYAPQIRKTRCPYCGGKRKK